MKRLTVILLSALLVLSLAACGNGSRNDRTETSARTQSATSAAESEAKEENLPFRKSVPTANFPKSGEYSYIS